MVVYVVGKALAHRLQGWGFTAVDFQDLSGGQRAYTLEAPVAIQTPSEANEFVELIAADVRRDYQNIGKP